MHEQHLEPKLSYNSLGVNIRLLSQMLYSALPRPLSTKPRSLMPYSLLDTNSICSIRRLTEAIQWFCDNVLCPKTFIVEPLYITTEKAYLNSKLDQSLGVAYSSWNRRCPLGVLLPQYINFTTINLELPIIMSAASSASSVTRQAIQAYQGFPKLAKPTTMGASRWSNGGRNSVGSSACAGTT